MLVRTGCLGCLVWSALQQGRAITALVTARSKMPLLATEIQSKVLCSTLTRVALVRILHCRLDVNLVRRITQTPALAEVLFRIVQMEGLVWYV